MSAQRCSALLSFSFGSLICVNLAQGAFTVGQSSYNAKERFCSQYLCTHGARCKPTTDVSDRYDANGFHEIPAHPSPLFRCGRPLQRSIGKIELQRAKSALEARAFLGEGQSSGSEEEEEGVQLRNRKRHGDLQGPRADARRCNYPFRSMPSGPAASSPATTFGERASIDQVRICLRVG